MKTNITKWSETRGEYLQPTETPEELTKYRLYNHEETSNPPLKLFAIGGKPDDNFTSNWDIYETKTGYFYSIARKGSTAESTIFGDINHIKNLIRQGYFNNTLTEYAKTKLAIK